MYAVCHAVHYIYIINSSYINWCNMFFLINCISSCSFCFSRSLCRLKKGGAHWQVRSTLSGRNCSFEVISVELMELRKKNPPASLVAHDSTIVNGIRYKGSSPEYFRTSGKGRPIRNRRSCLILKWNLHIPRPGMLPCNNPCSAMLLFSSNW